MQTLLFLTPKLAVINSTFQCALSANSCRFHEPATNLRLAMWRRHYIYMTTAINGFYNIFFLAKKAQFRG